MEQIRLLLVAARKDDGLACEILAMLQMGAPSVENAMYAYMTAEDWIEWLKHPNSSLENPVSEEALDDQVKLSTFESYADRYARELIASEDDVRRNIKALMNVLFLSKLWYGTNQALAEDVRLLYRALRYTANLFEERFGETEFTRILDEKEVPSMSELNSRYFTFETFPSYGKH